MSFFAARKGAGSRGNSSSNGGTSTTTTKTTVITGPSTSSKSTSTISTTNKPSSPAAVSGLVTLTRKVAAPAKNNLKERQALIKAKRERELREEYTRQQETARKDKKQRLDDRASSKHVNGEKDAQKSGKRRSKAAAHTKSDSDSDSATSARATPRIRVKRDRQAIESDSEGDLGTPVNERRQPLAVLRDNLAAPIDDLQSVDVVHGADLVQNNRKAYAAYFPDLPDDKEVYIEYPGDNAKERFLLARPKVKDEQDYHPIQDILTTVRTICDHFLTAEQALHHFKHIRNQTSSAFADFNFLNNPTPAIHSVSPSLTRDSTPAGSETGTPEPKAFITDTATPPPINKSQPLLRTLEKAYRRRNGVEFVAGIEWFNSSLVTLKEQGLIRQNIVDLGKSRGLPEAVWTGIGGQCYERTVGPRIEELKKYEAFSDNTYGELLPPLVSHIASLTGLNRSSVLVDMGSGVGNCVVQASLATGCKSYGFENQTAAAEMAAAQVREYNARCRLWGLVGGPCETHDADFLASASLVTPAIKAADVVLVNNYVFSPSTNESLSYLFLDLKEGAKIVSLKPFSHATGAVQITERNVGSPSSILVQSKPIRFDRGGVSWTAEGGVFYIAEVNRDRVKRWLERHGGM